MELWIISLSVLPVSFVYCAVTENPVRWNNSPIRVIILVSMGRNETDDEMQQQFYESVVEFALNGESVKTLIAHLALFQVPVIM